MQFPLFRLLFLVAQHLARARRPYLASACRRQTRMKWLCSCKENAASRLPPVPLYWEKESGAEAWLSNLAFLRIAVWVGRRGFVWLQGR